MTKIRTMPKTISVKIEAARDGTDYLNAIPGRDLVGLAELGCKIKVGIYKLVEVREVEGVASSRVISGA